MLPLDEDVISFLSLDRKIFKLIEMHVLDRKKLLN